MQPKNITFPTDAKLLHAAINGLNRIAKKHRGAAAAILYSYRQARGDDGGAPRPRQTVNRHRRQLRILRTRLGRLIWDIAVKIAGRARHRGRARSTTLWRTPSVKSYVQLVHPAFAFGRLFFFSLLFREEVGQHGLVDEGPQRQPLLVGGHLFGIGPVH